MSKLKDSKFQFSRPELLELQFNMNPNFDPEKKTTYQRLFDKEIQKSKEHNEAVVVVKWETGSEKSINPQYHISILMYSRFQWDNDLNEEQIDNLLKYNAVSLILSYMRPIVSQVTMNSTGIAYDIPYIDLTTEYSDDQHDNEQT